MERARARRRLGSRRRIAHRGSRPCRARRCGRRTATTRPRRAGSRVESSRRRGDEPSAPATQIPRSPVDRKKRNVRPSAAKTGSCVKRCHRRSRAASSRPSRSMATMSPSACWTRMVPLAAGPNGGGAGISTLALGAGVEREAGRGEEQEDRGDCERPPRRLSGRCDSGDRAHRKPPFEGRPGRQLAGGRGLLEHGVEVVGDPGCRQLIHELSEAGFDAVEGRSCDLPSSRGTAWRFERRR